MTYLQRINPEDCSTDPSRHVYLNQGELQKLSRLVSQEVASEFEWAESLKGMAKYHSGMGDKVLAKKCYTMRDRALQKANSWTEIQKNLKSGGETMKQHITDLDQRGLALCRVVDA